VKESKVISLEERAKDEAKSYLEELLSEGARKLLQTAIENEVAEYLEEHRERRIDGATMASMDCLTVRREIHRLRTPEFSTFFDLYVPKLS
jgi:hypothetical protein